MPSQLLPGGYFGLLLWFQLEDDLPLLIPRPKIPVTFDSKSMIKKALHSFFLPASPSFAETFRMNPLSSKIGLRHKSDKLLARIFHTPCDEIGGSAVEIVIELALVL
jgi:hypothetical protein